MALFSFFKDHKNQRYDYIPRYWNPEKEEREKRLRYLKTLEEEDRAEAVKSRLSQGFRRGGATGARTKQVSQSNWVLLATIVGLLLVTYIFLTKYLPQIVEAVEGAPK